MPRRASTAVATKRSATQRPATKRSVTKPSAAKRSATKPAATKPAATTRATKLAPRPAPRQHAPQDAAGKRAGREVDLDGHRGVLLQPANARALYVLAHGAGAGMHHPFMEAIAHALARVGIATLRWEFLFMSAGKKRPDQAPVAESSVQRVWAAAAGAGIARNLPWFAGGKSFGGRMSSRAHAAAPLAELRGLIFLGFPLHPPDKPGIERAEHLDAAAGPLLFVQGTRDDLADLGLLRPVIARLGPRATLHVVDRADHGFSLKATVIDELAMTVATWIDAILDRA